MPNPGAPVEILQRVPLFADLNKREVQQIARLFKERRFSEGETVVKEGSGGAAFFVIESGEATVFIQRQRAHDLEAGRLFRRNRPDRPGHAHGDDHRLQRACLLRDNLLGFPPTR